MQVKQNIKHTVWLYAVIALAGCVPHHEAHFKVSGKIGTIPPGWISKVYLLKVNDITSAINGSPTLVIDSAKIDKDGYFEFKNDSLIGKDTSLYRLNVITKDNYGNGAALRSGGLDESFIFLALSKKSDISVDVKDISEFAYSAIYVTADEENKELGDFLDRRKSQLKLMDSLWKKCNFIKKQNVADSVNPILPIIKNAFRSNAAAGRQICLQARYPLNTMAMANYIHGALFYMKTKEDTSFFCELDKRYQAKMPQNKFAMQYHDKLEKVLNSLGVGSNAPEIVMNDETGNTGALLSAYKGNYIVLDFWASWCHPCRVEIEETLKPLYKKYHRSGLQIIGISQDKSKEAWLKAIQEEGMKWKQVCDFNPNAKVFSDYNIERLPTIYVVSPDGKIVAKGLIGSDLEQFIDKVFSKS